VFHIYILGVEILFGGFSSEFWVSCDSVAPNWEVWRAAVAALLPDIAVIQNKVICF